MASRDSVLIVDDEEDFCMVMSQYFKKRHIKCTCAYSLSDANQALETIQPTLVILDNNLPDGLGISLIPEIKGMPSPASVVVVTGYDAEKIGPHAIKLGADMFIPKPLNVGQINQVVNKFLEDKANIGDRA